jgi:hypothetical protein
MTPGRLIVCVVGGNTSTRFCLRRLNERRLDYRKLVAEEEITFRTRLKDKPSTNGPRCGGLD